MRSTRIIIAVSLPLFLSALVGCAVGPRYGRPVTSASGVYCRQAPDTNLGVAFETKSLGDADWQSVFQDGQLQVLIRAALQNNYDVHIAADRILAAQAQLGITHADRLPSATERAASASTRSAESKLNPPEPMETGPILAAASWEVEFWGKYREATEATRPKIAATQWGRHAVVSTLIANVATSYYQLGVLDQQLEITQDIVKSRQESLRLIKMLTDSNAAPMMDVGQAEQIVDKASADATVLEQRIKQQEDVISTLLGVNPGSIARGKSASEQQRMASIPPSLPSQLLDRRPDIRQAEENLAAANARISVAKAALFPSILLTETGGYRSSALTNLFSGSAGFWNAREPALQPVFQGGRLRNNLRLSESEQRQSLTLYQRTVQNAFREVSDGLVAYRKTHEARQQQESLVTAAQNTAYLTRVRYQGGATSYLEVLTSETNYYSAELALSRARLSEMLAVVQVYNSLGGGWRM